MGLRVQGTKGVCTVFEHVLGVVVSISGSLDAEVTEHGVRFLVAKELDGILVDLGT